MKFVLKCIAATIIVAATLFFGSAFVSALLERHYHPPPTPEQVKYQECLALGYDLIQEKSKTDWIAKCKEMYPQ